MKRTGVRGSLCSQGVVCTLSFPDQHSTKSALCDVRVLAVVSRTSFFSGGQPKALTICGNRSPALSRHRKFQCDGPR
jgi:hypothetical protein